MSSSFNQNATQWRLFLRAFADEIDTLASPQERDDMLRNVGVRMARLAPIPAVPTFNMLQIEINDALAGLGWGRAIITLNEEDRCLWITHYGAPRLGSAGDPPGTWLSAMLEGLYTSWFESQPNSDSSLTARRHGDVESDTVTLRYGRI
jgi:hypothetical protein